MKDFSQYTYEQFVGDIYGHNSSNLSMKIFNQVPEEYIRRLILSDNHMGLNYMYCNCLWSYISADSNKIFKVMPHWYMKYFDIAFNRILTNMKKVYQFFNRTHASIRLLDTTLLEPYICQTMLEYHTKFIDYNLSRKDIYEIFFFFDLFYEYYTPKQIIKFFIKIKKNDEFVEYIANNFRDKEFLNKTTQRIFRAMINLHLLI